MSEIFEINKLYTYPQICRIKGEKILRGNSFIKHVKTWNIYEKWEKTDRKYRYLGDRTEEEIAHKLAKPHEYSVDLYNFDVPIENYNSAGIYKIQLNALIYIGQTVNFKKRFSKHYNGNGGQYKGKPYQMLKSGAKFGILEIVDDLEERQKRELYYIQKYMHDDNFECINSRVTSPQLGYYNANRGSSIETIKFKRLYIDESNYDEVIKYLDDAGIKYKTNKKSIIGECPICGNNVYEKVNGFFCNEYNCKFGIWKNNSLFASLSIIPTKEIVEELLETGKAELKDCVSQKTGKRFDCFVIIEVSEDDNVRLRVEF